MNLQPTILVVDDEKHTRDGLRRLLENDYDVYVAADIAGATDVLEREQIDVLLTDLRLGHEDGTSLIDRAGNICCDIHVIIILEQTAQAIARVLFVIHNEDGGL